jgi:hypothetical protein
VKTPAPRCGWPGVWRYADSERDAREATPGIPRRESAGMQTAIDSATL